MVFVIDIVMDILKRHYIAATWPLLISLPLFMEIHLHWSPCCPEHCQHTPYWDFTLAAPAAYHTLRSPQDSLPYFFFTSDHPIKSHPILCHFIEPYSAFFHFTAINITQHAIHLCIVDFLIFFAHTNLSNMRARIVFFFPPTSACPVPRTLLGHKENPQ